MTILPIPKSNAPETTQTMRPPNSGQSIVDSVLEMNHQTQRARRSSTQSQHMAALPKQALGSQHGLLTYYSYTPLLA